MKKTNKVLLTLTSLVLALGLFACNKNKNSSPDESSDNISDSTISENVNSESESVGNTSSPSESEVVVVYELSLSESSLSLIVGQSQTVQATLLKDGEACDDAIEWVSSNESVAKVENGKVIAVSAGNATITASAHGKQATVEVEVEEDIGEVFLIVDPEKADLEIGETLQLNAQLLGSEEEPQLTYYSSNDDVVTVDQQTGLVTARGNGDATITIVHGDVNDQIIAYCEITVESNIQLIFPEIEQKEWFVGDTIDTNAMIKADGSGSQEGIVITGSGFTVNGDEITLTEDGVITITVNYEGQQPISREIMAYHKIATAQDWANVNNDLAGYYKLANNIDLKGGTLTTIAHYADNLASSNAETSGFSGILDGNGFAIMNYSKSLGSNGTATNSSPIGSIAKGGIVKNINFINGTIDNYIGGGIATMNSGTIQDSFANILVKYNPASNANSKNNPIGGIVSKNYGTIKNSIAVVSLADGIDTTMIGSIAGRNYASAKILDSYSISTLGVCESATPSNTPTNAYSGEITNVSVVATLDELNALVTANNSFDKKLWNVTEQNYPLIGGLDIPINVTQTEYDVFAGSNVSIIASSDATLYYSLKQEINGVIVDADGKVSVDASVEPGTDIEVLVKNYYGPSVTITITVKALTYSIDSSSYQPLSFNVTKGSSAESEFVKAHNIVVKYNNEVYTGDAVTFVSSNENVATADINNVTAVGDGTATISVLADGSEIYSFEVSVEMWFAVKTKADFLAIDASTDSLKGKYKLVNDIDFGGETITTFTSYYAYNDSNYAEAWRGIFDGQGHTISNFTVGKRIRTNNSTDNDAAIFGYMLQGSVVRNVNFVGVKTSERSAVVASWVEGTVENVFVEVTYISDKNTTKNQNNPASSIASKVHNFGTVKNCIAVVDAIYPEAVEGDVKGGSGTQSCFGSVVGKTNNAGATIENCMSITKLNAPAIFDTTTTPGTVTNVTTHTTLANFYANAVVSSFDTNVWTFAEGKYPHVGQMANIMSVVDTEMEAYANATVTVKVNSGIDVYYKLASEVSNVSINETTGVVTIGDVVVGTNIEVVVYNLYTNETITVTLTVVEANYEANNPNSTMTISDKIIGEKVAHNVTVTKDGQPYTGSEITFTSDNENVVVADATNITIKGEGTAVVTVAVNGISLTTIEVTTSALWTPITTVAEFNAIDNNLTGKYKLMNDLDYQGGTLTTIAHWNSGAGTGARQFAGIFDGQGYTIKNFVNNNTSTNGNYSLFGTVNTVGVIRNLNVSGTLAARIAGGIVTINNGTVENCFANISITYTDSTNSDGNNPMGGIASKNEGTIKNCVTVVSVSGTNTSVIGAIVGRNTAATAKVENCYSMTSASIKLYSHTGNTTEGTNIISSSVVTSLEALNNAISNDATFDKVNTWTITTGSNPKVKVQA